MRRHRALVGHLFVGLGLLATDAPARTWRVNVDGTGDAPTIQAAVFSAVAGDTIELGCGTYHEDGIGLKGGLHLVSATGEPDCAIIAPLSGLDAALWAVHTVAPITFTGLDFQGPSGPGLLFAGNAPCAFERCRFLNGSWVEGHDLSGGGVFSMRDCAGVAGGNVRLGFAPAGGAASIEDCTFDDSGIQVNGGPSAFSVSIRDTQFSGASILFTGRGPLSLTSCSLSDAASSGPLRCQNGTVVSVDSCTFRNNRAGEGGAAISCRDDCSLTVRSSSFLDNEVTGSGGAMWLRSSGFTIENCRFAGNRAADEGGALYAEGLVAPFPSIANCVFTGNRCGTFGGALSFANAASPVITNCTIADNLSEVVAGAINAPAYSFVQLEKCIVWGNCALLVPGIYGPDVSASCCDIQGGWSGSNVFDADPEFCTPRGCADAPQTGGPYTLQSDSPCLPAGNACGVLIGARPEGCTTVMVERQSWARIKSQYR